MNANAELSAVLDGPVHVAVRPIAIKIPLYVAPDGEYCADRLKSIGEWEPTETACVCRLLAKGGRFLDVGANLGYYSVLAHHLVGPAGRIVALEPDPDNHSRLLANLRLNGIENCRPILAAAGAVDGNTVLFRSASNSGDIRTASGEGLTACQTVRTIRLDDPDILADGPYDLVKVDCQGAELDILAGMDGMLRDAPPGSMILEFWPHGLASRGQSADDLISALEGLPYSIFDMGRWRQRPRPVDLAALRLELGGFLAPETGHFTNLLLVRRDLKDRMAAIEQLC
jgi:FkbM family methyltransferase